MEIQGIFKRLKVEGIMMITHNDLHRIIDEIPEGKIDVAYRALLIMFSSTEPDPDDPEADEDVDVPDEELDADEDVDDENGVDEGELAGV